MAMNLFKQSPKPTQEPPLGEAGPADEILGRLLDPGEIIDRYDASYLDDLPVILAEVHGIDEDNARDHPQWLDLLALWEFGNRPASEFRLADLRETLLQSGVDERRWTPRHAPPDEQKRQKYTRARTFGRAASERLHGAAERVRTVAAIKQLQIDYSHDVQGGKHETVFEALARPETGDPWSSFIVELRERGVISCDEAHLTIGPRWVGEIHYFRDRLGLRQTIGLDLFTHDDELVKVGDMHEMPFDDSSFGLIYQRNTFDKAYDIRRTLHECVRVLRDGGVLISDDCYDYTHGVSQLGRTNIKHNRQVLRVLGDNVAEVLYDKEPASAEDWIARYGQLAVRVKK